ncbi:response regulator transcription factor [Aquimarina sp. M1]
MTGSVKGYLPKDTEKKILEKALIEIQETGFYHTKDVTNLLLHSCYAKKENSRILKEREIEFVKQTCTNKTYKKIASDMCISPKIIEGYRDAVFEKLNPKNKTAIVIYAIRNQIVIP